MYTLWHVFRADDDLVGQISNAIVACAEPKVSSSFLLKQYIIQYHPEFKIAEKPLNFKKALQRAIVKKLITLVFYSYTFHLKLSNYIHPAYHLIYLHPTYHLTYLHITTCILQPSHLSPDIPASHLRIDWLIFLLIHTAPCIVLTVS